MFTQLCLYVSTNAVTERYVATPIPLAQRSKF
jgi:hypothetical protein